MEKLTLVPLGGLANRIRSIVSTIAFCQENNVPLEILWFKDWGMGATFHQLFKLSPNIKDTIIKDASPFDYFTKDRPRKKNLWLPSLFLPLFHDAVIVEAQCESLMKTNGDHNVLPALLKHKKPYLVSCWEMYHKVDMYNYLQYDDQVLRKVNTTIQQNENNLIGIHIRRGDLNQSIMNSPDQLFLDRIEHELQSNPQCKFYLATDDATIKHKFIKQYPNNIITLAVAMRRDSAEGIADALTEMLILSKTKEIWGSHSSSYSEVAALIGGIKNRVVSK